jgi:hypothetical protein
MAVTCDVAVKKYFYCPLQATFAHSFIHFTGLITSHITHFFLPSDHSVFLIVCALFRLLALGATTTATAAGAVVVFVR